MKLFDGNIEMGGKSFRATVIAVVSVMMVAAAAFWFTRTDVVKEDTIVLGSAISFTGKYSTNGIHASNGYNLAVRMINEAGGVKIGGGASPVLVSGAPTSTRYHSVTRSTSSGSRWARSS